MYPIKGFTDRFDSVGEFVDNLSRGGEIEFVYNGDQYSITHPGGRLNIGCIASQEDRFFDSIDQLLDFKIDDKCVRDIVTEIQPTFRCF